MPRTGRLDLRRRVVFADDATGALEAGALLASSGAVVRLNGRSDPERAVQVVMLATRHLSAKQAQLAVAAAVAGEAEAAIYWKTDSTLRGPIGACFRVLLQRFPDRRIVYCPAYPSLGRTVRNGNLLVHGVPVDQTAFAQDPANPVRNSAVREVIGIEPDESRVVIHDAETELEVAAIIRSASPADIVAGPAGGIRYWGSGMPEQHTPVQLPHGPGAWIVVCGSRHPVSLAQAAEASIPVLRTADGDLDDLARRAVLIAGSPGMILFGGDTALAVWRALVIEELQPLGEILPGIALSQTLDGTRRFITKAGGFGGPGLIPAILKRWETRA